MSTASPSAASPSASSAPAASAPAAAAPVGRSAARGAGAPATRRMPRLLGLALAEIALLRRNRMQLGTALVLPLVMPFAFLPLKDLGTEPAALTGVLGTMIVMVMLFVVYYNLLSSYVARRQDLVLKRLRTGESSDATVLAATAVPALVLATVMITLMLALSVPLLDLPLPAHPLVLALGLVLGAVMLVPLALVTANITRTVESAQVTSLPAMAVLLLGTGTLLPAAILPDWAGRVMAILPSAPITALTRLGWLGLDADGATVQGADLWLASAPQFGILLGWGLLGALVVREHFRWEPRG